MNYMAGKDDDSRPNRPLEEHFDALNLEKPVTEQN